MSAAPLPDVDWPLLREYWAGAARGELLIPRCGGCGDYVWYPRETCPSCQATQMPWVVVSGRGTLFSWCLVDHPLFPPFADKTPYVTGMVALEEDPRVRIVTLIEDCAPEELAMEMPMQVDFRPLRFSGSDAAVTVPYFVPAD
jgi:uncharacterized OB-fold protein